MVIRLILIIFFVASSAYAQKCLTCHTVHYEDTGKCITCHRGNDKSSRLNIAHDGLISAEYSDYLTNSAGVKRGEKLIDASSCRRCHIVSDSGNGLAPNLSSKAAEKTAEQLSESISKPTDFMPDFRFRENDLSNVVRYLLSTSESDASRREPYTVFVKPSGDNVFDKYCGGCHRILTLLNGPMGGGDTAPNLSGLFSKHYQPIKLKKGEKWTTDTLKRWLKNPRETDRLSTMPPVKLTDKEFIKLINLLN